MWGKVILGLMIIGGLYFVFTSGSDWIANGIADFYNGIDAEKNKIITRAGETECDLKVTVSGDYGFQTGDFTGTESIENVKNKYIWANCVKKGQLSILPVFYSEKLNESLKNFEDLAVYGRLFGEEFSYWIELHDPSTGELIAREHQKVDVKVPAGFGAWHFEHTFVFFDIPKRNLELWIFSDATFVGHQNGQPYKQIISP